MPLTEENYEIWYKYFRAALHRISRGWLSQFDKHLEWIKEDLIELYLGEDYATAARDEFELQVSYAL